MEKDFTQSLSFDMVKNGIDCQIAEFKNSAY